MSSNWLTTGFVPYLSQVSKTEKRSIGQHGSKMHYIKRISNAQDRI